MHTDLSPHLHTEECNKLINAWFQCNKDHAFLKFVGACNSEDHQMLLCMKRERMRTRDKNAEEANIKRSAIKQRVLADLEEEKRQEQQEWQQRL